MTPPNLPAGFELVRSRDGLAVVRSAARSWLLPGGVPDRAAFDALRASGRPAGTGRGCVVAVDLGGGADGRAIIRHCCRGGALGGLLGDRYLRGMRPVEELRVGEAARAAGVPTPEYLAAFIWRRGPFYSGDLVVREVPGAVPLTDWLAQHPDRASVARIATALAEAFAQLFTARIHHRDLHAGNVLVADSGLWLIDFDRAVQRGKLPDRLRNAMLFRFNRALVKRGLSPDPVTLSARVRFCRGLGVADDPEAFRRFLEECDEHLQRHRWRYRDQ